MVFSAKLFSFDGFALFRGVQRTNRLRHARRIEDLVDLVFAQELLCARILADDYVGPSAEGPLMGKAEYLNTIERDTTIEKYEFHDLKLQLAGSRATLTGGISYVIQGQNVSYNFTDRFVWRNGRWQATGSEIQRKE